MSVKFLKTFEILPIPNQLSTGLILLLAISDVGWLSIPAEKTAFNLYSAKTMYPLSLTDIFYLPTLRKI